MKAGDILIVRNLSEIEASGGNTSDMTEGEEVIVVSAGYNYINTNNSKYGSFTIQKDKDGLNWYTFFTKKEEK